MSTLIETKAQVKAFATSWQSSYDAAIEKLIGQIAEAGDISFDSANKVFGVYKKAKVIGKFDYINQSVRLLLGGFWDTEVILRALAQA